MMTFDRMILAQYSLDAMNASVAAILVAAIFQYGLSGISSIAQVFVGQYNGAGDFRRVAEPVWQMLWFSAATLLVFWPLGLWGADVLIGQHAYREEAEIYFRIIMLFGPCVPAIAAASTFFVGLGKSHVVTRISIVGNLANLIMDVILVFGVPGWIPSYGIAGAAWATGISQVLQLVLLLALMQKPAYRAQYGTGCSHFCWSTMKECLRIGTPSSISLTVEVSAWAFLSRLMAEMGELHMTAFAVGHSIFILFFCGLTGLHKGVVTVVSNYLGAERWEVIHRLLGTALRLHGRLLACFVLPLVIYSDPIISLFVHPDASDQLWFIARVACASVWVCYCFEGTAMILSGFLTAGGDTKYAALVNSSVSWGLAVFPCWWIVVYNQANPIYLWGILTFYGMGNTFFYFIRYRSGHWCRQLKARATDSDASRGSY